MSVFKLCSECVHCQPDGKGLGYCLLHACKVPLSKMNSAIPACVYCKDWKLQKSKEYKEQSNG